MRACVFAASAVGSDTLCRLFTLERVLMRPGQLIRIDTSLVVFKAAIGQACVTIQ